MLINNNMLTFCVNINFLANLYTLYIVCVVTIVVCGNCVVPTNNNNIIIDSNQCSLYTIFYVDRRVCGTGYEITVLRKKPADILNARQVCNSCFIVKSLTNQKVCHYTL